MNKLVKYALSCVFIFVFSSAMQAMEKLEKDPFEHKSDSFFRYREQLDENDLKSNPIKRFFLENHRLNAICLCVDAGIIGLGMSGLGIIMLDPGSFITGAILYGSMRGLAHQIRERDKKLNVQAFQKMDEEGQQEFLLYHEADQYNEKGHRGLIGSLVPLAHWDEGYANIVNTSENRT